jgi:putative tricarboxylic transport membrane protein
MKRAEALCAVVLLILAVAVGLEAIRLDIGWGDIGPKGGFFPFWLAVILGLSSLSVLLSTIPAWSQAKKAPFLGREQLGLLLTVLVPIALVIPLIETVGFYLTAFLYLSSYIWWTGSKKLWVNLTISIVFPMAIYFVFEKWFLIPLPKGLLEAYLPF